MNIVTDVILPLALAFIMFVLGLGLTSGDFLRVAKQPRDFFVGALSQVILLPVIAFILVKIWPIITFTSLAPELVIGVMIIAAAPGGVTSNILTAFAKGDVALSISLTAIISLLCVVTIPFIVFESLSYLTFTEPPKNVYIFDLALKLFLLVTVPVILGMLLRRFASGVALKFEPIAKKISIFLFVLVLLGAIATERENVIYYFAQAGLITLVLNVVMMVVAYFVAKAFASGISQKKCITIECGLQNGTLAIFVANSIFDGGMYVIPAATYSLIMFATSLIFVYLVKKVS